MKRRTRIAITIFADALTATSAPTCNAPQVVQGNNCTLTVSLPCAAGILTQKYNGNAMVNLPIFHSSVP